LLPEIKAYMAKARLRRGIEIVKLANRIEALKMQEDEEDESQADLPSNPKAAAQSALSGADAGHASSGSSSAPGEPPKKTLSSIAKGAIFREVVLAKVREIKQAEDAAKMEQEAREKAASKGK
jgi:calcium/calmodulin-dependent protein kinase I